MYGLVLGEEGPGDVFGSRVCRWHLLLGVSSGRRELRSLSREASALRARRDPQNRMKKVFQEGGSQRAGPKLSEVGPSDLDGTSSLCRCGRVA